jgi:hypothetical protein
MKTPILKFILDENYSVHTALYLLIEKNKGKDYGDVRLDSDKLNNIRLLLEKGMKVEAADVIKREYYEKGMQCLLKETLPLYQRSWDKINNKFFRMVSGITGYAWNHEEYYCALSPFVRGVSTWDGGDTIVRTCADNSYIMRKITAHELILAHVFNILNTVHKEENPSETQKWGISECSAFIITGLDDFADEFWPWLSKEKRYVVQHNYPELQEFQGKMKAEYEKKHNFNDALKWATVEAKKYSW